MPAVVNVSSARVVTGPRGRSGPFFSDPFFRFFYGPETAPRRERSLGSGVVVTPDGTEVLVPFVSALVGDPVDGRIEIRDPGGLF